jgi:hypothetical protein
MSEEAGGVTAVQVTVHESLEVEVTVTVGAAGVSTAQNSFARDRGPSPIDDTAETEKR